MCYTCNSNNYARSCAFGYGNETSIYGCQRVCRDANGFLRCTQYGSVNNGCGCGCNHCCQSCHCCVGNGTIGNSNGATSGNNDGYGCLTICGNLTSAGQNARVVSGGYYPRSGSCGRCGRSCGCGCGYNG